MNMEQMRKEFESWRAALCVNDTAAKASLEREGDGYYSTHTELAWKAWQAATAAANPATVLAMAARIEELERIERVASCGTVQNWLTLPDEDKAKWFAQTVKRDSKQCKRIWELEAQLNAATLARREAQMETQLAREARNRAGIEARRGMFKLIKGARIEGWLASQETAARQCMSLNVYPAEDTRRRCYQAIRAMRPPAEWGDHVEHPLEMVTAAKSESLCNTCARANVSCPVYPLDTQHCVEHVPECGAAPNVEWKHEDGFGGGLTERTENGQDHQG